MEGAGKFDMKQKVAQAKSYATDGLKQAKEKALNFDIKKAPADVVTWARENPGKATMHGASLILLAAPGVVTWPALGVVGFGAEGVVAGSSAAAVQAAAGNFAARGVFAHLQSAAMGGYGLPVINTVARVAIVAGQGIYGAVTSRAGKTAHGSETVDDQVAKSLAEELEDEDEDSSDVQIAEEPEDE